MFVQYLDKVWKYAFPAPSWVTESLPGVVVISTCTGFGVSSRLFVLEQTDLLGVLFLNVTV